jgi:hypothetical protein
MENTGDRPVSLVRLTHLRNFGGQLNVTVNKLNDCLRVGLTASATCQTFGELNRALSAQTSTARFAGTDRLPVFVIETTHKCMRCECGLTNNGQLGFQPILIHNLNLISRKMVCPTFFAPKEQRGLASHEVAGIHVQQHRVLKGRWDIVLPPSLPGRIVFGRISATSWLANFRRRFATITLSCPRVLRVTKLTPVCRTAGFRARSMPPR